MFLGVLIACVIPGNVINDHRKVFGTVVFIASEPVTGEWMTDEASVDTAPFIAM